MINYNLYLPNHLAFYDFLFYLVGLDKPFNLSANFGSERLSYSYSDRVLINNITKQSFPIYDKFYLHYYNYSKIPIYVYSPKKNNHRGTYRICPVWKMLGMSKSVSQRMGFEVYL